MNPIITFILGLIVGFGMAYAIKRSKGDRVAPVEYGLTPSPLGRFHGASNYNQKKEKEENKEKILEYLKERGEVGNDDIQKLLNVSDATVTNYMSELEAEGVVEQIGDEGRGVKYRAR